tara:strand:+ start:434 stop:844 length:411 start_codon:yes stop_codon:yes gene_type:complete
VRLKIRVKVRVWLRLKIRVRLKIRAEVRVGVGVRAGRCGRVAAGAGAGRGASPYRARQRVAAEEQRRVVRQPAVPRDHLEIRGGAEHQALALDGQRLGLVLHGLRDLVAEELQHLRRLLGLREARAWGEGRGQGRG